MPELVTELAVIRWNQPHADNPLSDVPHVVGSEQSAWSKLPFLYFEDINDNQTVYILAGWHSVEAHEEWIGTNQNKALLAKYAPFIEHMSLRHIRVNCTEMPEDVNLLVWIEAAQEDVVEVEGARIPYNTLWDTRGVEIEDKQKVHRFRGYSVDDTTSFLWRKNEVQAPVSRRAAVQIMRRVYSNL